MEIFFSNHWASRFCLIFRTRWFFPLFNLQLFFLDLRYFLLFWNRETSCSSLEWKLKWALRCFYFRYLLFWLFWRVVSSLPSNKLLFNWFTNKLFDKIICQLFWLLNFNFFYYQSLHTWVLRWSLGWRAWSRWLSCNISDLCRLYYSNFSIVSWLIILNLFCANSD